ncbi:hypothetical protein BDR26DRAFT_892738 [Obelidium mucronatum]|nr:hypothetical protein BDR26DRAFT_892738 [Obelidium mucronatum]
MSSKKGNIPRPANIQATDYKVSTQKLKEILEYLQDTGVSTQVNDKDYREPPVANAQLDFQLGPMPVAPAEQEIADLSPEEAAKYREELEVYHKAVKSYLDASNAKETSTNNLLKKEESYRKWRVEQDTAIGTYKSFFPRSKWDQIESHADFIAKRTLYVAINTTKILFVELKHSGLDFQLWIQQTSETRFLGYFY